MKNAGILTIGNEILQGYTLDSNSNHISKELTIRNIDVTIQLTVPDVVSKIKEKIDKFIIKDYDYIFITGGLGPTHDDVTKKALLELFGCKLSFLEDRHNKLVQNFGKPIPKCQSEILEISKPIDNNLGTALGMYIELEKSKIIILPGVPSEMKQMLNSYFGLDELLINKNQNIFTINTFGIYETKLSDKMKDIIKNYKDKVYFSFLPSYEGVRLRVKILENNNIKSDSLKEELMNFLSEYAYSCDDISLEETILNLLIKNNLKISLAESCTGGLISKSITDLPGSSKIFIGSLVAYNNSIKNNFLDISNDIIEKYGAVSHEVSELMANNISKNFESDIALSCTGISGPDGGSDKKPVGTVYISIKFLDKLLTNKFVFKLDRKSHRLMTKQTALYMLWKLLINLKY